jgi:hypothetical protein
MRDRTLISLAVTALLTLGACTTPETTTASAEIPPDSSGWLLGSGKAPTKAEFTALVATCQDKGGAMDPCLSNLGLKRAP